MAIIAQSPSTEELSTEALKLPDPFEIVSIRPVAAPPGAAGQNWHRYEISQGVNTIVGYRAGATDIVREIVELIVVGLNVRRTCRRGRVHIALHSKTSKGLQ
jgi:hypothetical protein